MSKESKRLSKVLVAAGADELQIRMAVILLSVNGIDNALEFVHGLRERGLASQAQGELNFARPEYQLSVSP